MSHSHRQRLMRDGPSSMKTHEKWDWRRHLMSVDTSDGHPAMDYKQHEATYRGFIKGTLYTVIGLALLLIIMAATLV
jgi:hypothetical protein